jgi:signal peptidase I
MRLSKHPIYLISIILISFLLTIFIMKRFCLVYKVDQHSMENTLLDGDKVLVTFKNTISRNNIVVFKYNNIAFVKRLIGTPGDSILIKNNLVYVNGIATRSPYPLKSEISNPDKNIMILNTFGKRWTLSNWGPVVVPAKGVSIELTPENYTIYEHIIKKEQEKPINIQAHKAVRLYYTFKNDYIFVLGDNRLHSDDSRLFGFIPVSNLVGKTNLVLYSMNGMSRILKQIK